MSTRGNEKNGRTSTIDSAAAAFAAVSTPRLPITLRIDSKATDLSEDRHKLPCVCAF